MAKLFKSINSSQWQDNLVFLCRNKKRGVLLDLVLTNKEGLLGHVKVGGNLVCNDHEIEFRILRVKQGKN